jgi:hypothetical protein
MVRNYDTFHLIDVNEFRLQFIVHNTFNVFKCGTLHVAKEMLVKLDKTYHMHIIEHAVIWIVANCYGTMLFVNLC